MASAAVLMADTAAPASMAIQTPTEKSKQLKPRRALRPNYNQIHQNLLPVEIHPLPTLIPHNPLSLVAIVLSYLTRIIAPPQRSTYNSYFSPATSSVHVTDRESIRAPWEMGFFGRGNLSRSEPTWQEAQKRKGSTAEENTGNRRNERRQQKLERARKEQADITQQLSKEQHANSDVESLQLNGNMVKTNASDMSGIASVLESHDIPGSAAKLDDQWKKNVTANGIPTPPPSIASEGEFDRPAKRFLRSKTVRFSPTTEAREFDLSSPVISPIKSPGSVPFAEVKEIVSTPAPITSAPSREVENKEHLTLALEEAFFLSYGLGVLNIYCENSDTILSSASLLSLFRRYSYHPTRSLSVPQEPDDPFMLSYAVYHHYRSLGWVVRSGVKFSVNFLLYNRGPAFAHAEFAIIVLPAYSHSYWSETTDRKHYVMTKTRKSWDWLHGINRVQAQVHKSLILCYVEVPSPIPKSDKGQQIDVEKELSRYTIRDVSVKRWTPNRTRD